MLGPGGRGPWGFALSILALIVLEAAALGILAATYLWKRRE